MRKKYGRIFLRIVLVSGIIMALACFFYRSKRQAANPGDWRVALNAVRQESQKLSPEHTELDARLEELAHILKQQTQPEPILVFGLTWLIFIACTGGLMFYLYKQIIRPFEDLEAFSQELARGNFQMDLPYEKNNYFGNFTWAFDSMRREILAARSRETQALEDNKLIISTLSHDIKTPIASIRAYSEALGESVVRNPEQEKQYVDVIIRKCDEVSKLTDDLFLHALSEMDKLQINPELLHPEEFVRKLVEDYRNTGLNLDFEARTSVNCLLSADPVRLQQILENLIRNSQKYGKAPYKIVLWQENEEVFLSVSDAGPGIPPEDLSFVLTKFYRGKNSRGEEGSGLGLYIVDHLVKKMQGRLTLQNTPTGFCVTMAFPGIP